MAQTVTDVESTGVLPHRGSARRRHAGPEHSLGRARVPTPTVADGEESRWAARPRVAAAVRVSVVLALVGSAVGSAYLLSTALPLWSGWARIPRGLLLVAVSTAVFYGMDKLGRRVMPLAMLLELSLCFPDQLPSRFALALRGARVRDMDVATAEAVATPPGTPAEALTRCIVLLGALTTHDRRTRGHCERVRALSDLLAAQVGLSVENRDRMRWAALLHDIGKLHVDHDLLNKSGIPTEDEWEVLRAHPSVGAVMVEPLRDWLGDCVDAIGQHHERWDGQGYPNGLVGRQISFAGRLIAVVDAYEVMTAPRSYKRPVSARAARRELVRCASTHFDPMMVRSFLNISLGDLRRSLGPMAWVGDIPLLGRVPRYEGSLAAVGRQLAVTATSATGATAVAVTTAVTLGPLAASALATSSSSGHAHSHDAAPQVLASGAQSVTGGGNTDTKVLGTSFSAGHHGGSAGSPAPSSPGSPSLTARPLPVPGGGTQPGSHPQPGSGHPGLIASPQLGVPGGGAGVAGGLSTGGVGSVLGSAYGLQGGNGVGNAYGLQGGNGNGNAYGLQGGNGSGHQGGNGNGNAYGHQGGSGSGNGNGNGLQGGNGSGHQGGNGNGPGNASSAGNASGTGNGATHGGGANGSGQSPAGGSNGKTGSAPPSGGAGGGAGNHGGGAGTPVASPGGQSGQTPGASTKSGPATPPPHGPTTSTAVKPPPPPGKVHPATAPTASTMVYTAPVPGGQGKQPSGPTATPAPAKQAPVKAPAPKPAPPAPGATTAKTAPPPPPPGKTPHTLPAA